MALTQARVVQWSTSAAVLDTNLALTTALNKLRTFCVNNAASYERFIWHVGIDIATGNFTFAASAHVYPAAFTSLHDAQEQLGGISKAYAVGNVAL